MMAAAKIRMGIAVDCMPTPSPAMMLVAEPVSDWLTMPLNRLSTRTGVEFGDHNQ